MSTINAAADFILTARQVIPESRAVLVALSGIDASGKGYLAAQLGEHLNQQGHRTIVLGVDGWLNLPPVRFNPADPGGHFYEHALRFDAMFAQLVLPLRDQRAVAVEMDYTEETATQYRRQRYEFGDVDIVLVEGIFLLKRAHRHHFDVRLWVDCSFDTALERALRRGQEGLPPAETVRAFETIYFPAQRIHEERDEPRAAADLIIVNDPRRDTPHPA